MKEGFILPNGRIFLLTLIVILVFTSFRSIISKFPATPNDDYDNPKPFILGLDTYSSSDIPKTILTGSPNTITSIITVPSSNGGIINDINLTNLAITHTYIKNLNIRLRSPLGTEIVLLARPCEDQDNIAIDFDDEGNSFASIPCPPTNGLAYQPSESLTAFDGESPVGNWTLTIEDVVNGDGGSLNSWALEINTIPPIEIGDLR